MFKVTLSDRDFRALSEFIHTEYGIKMPASKKIMLEARLQKRLRTLGMKSFTEYCEYLFSPEGTEHELVHMINAVTTNKTDFFREAAHFDYLCQKALPELITRHGSGVGEKLMVWSAGCSTGEEPYTLAMVMNEFAKEYPGLRFNYEILATDISARVLEKAKLGVYAHEKVEPVPIELRKKYLLRSRDRKQDMVRVAPELRAAVKFRRLNFMDEDFRLREPVDIIFCRNVVIYFDRPTQEKLLNQFYRCMVPGGYLFMGHSETLHGMNVPFVKEGAVVYRKPA